MKWNNNTYQNNNSILFNEALVNDYNGYIDIKAEYKAFLKECTKLINKVSNYFDNTARLNNTKLVSVEQIEDLINQSYTNQNNSNQNNNIEKDIWLDDEESQNSKITIIEKNHIKKEIEITHDELLVLKLATLHNGNIVNLMSKTEEIKNLINKGLLHLSETGDFIVVNKIIELIIKTNSKQGSIIIPHDNDTDEGLEKEIISDGYNDNVEGFEWDMMVEEENQDN